MERTVFPSRHRREPRPVALVLLLVISTVVCASAAFLSTIHLREEQQKSQGLAERLRNAEDRSDRFNETIVFLRERLGYRQSMDLDELRRRVSEDLQAFSDDVPTEDYRSTLAYLVQTIAAERTRAAELSKVNKELQNYVKTMQPAYERQVEIHKEQQEKTFAELVRVEDQTRGSLRILEDQIATMLDRLETTSQKLRQAYRQRERDQGKSERQVSALLAQIHMLRAQKDHEVDVDDDPPDGKILFADASAGTVTLNIGQSDGVRRGMTFRVFRANIDGQAEKSVATVNVLRVRDKQSVARIVDNNLLVPILPGDLIFSPILRDRKTESFALAGNLDADGDGTDDSMLLKRLIESQGGRIDLRIDHRGEVHGKLSLNTKYVIMDDKSRQGDRAYREILSALHQEALDHGIPVISARRFADQLGHTRGLPGSSTAGVR